MTRSMTALLVSCGPTNKSLPQLFRPAPTSPRREDGAVEPENIVRDVITSFRRRHAAVPFTSLSTRT
jgi:hypothetical protein